MNTHMRARVHKRTHIYLGKSIKSNRLINCVTSGKSVHKYMY
jgi:hypothetical protein